jgi:hypothetical protein
MLGKKLNFIVVAFLVIMLATSVLAYPVFSKAAPSFKKYSPVLQMKDISLEKQELKMKDEIHDFVAFETAYLAGNEIFLNFYGKDLDVWDGSLEVLSPATGVGELFALKYNQKEFGLIINNNFDAKILQKIKCNGLHPYIHLEEGQTFVIPEDINSEGTPDPSLLGVNMKLLDTNRALHVNGSYEYYKSTATIELNGEELEVVNGSRLMAGKYLLNVSRIDSEDNEIIIWPSKIIGEGNLDIVGTKVFGFIENIPRCEFN